MRNLLSIFLLLVSLPALAANYITISVTFTNIPATGDTFVRNATTARWTNGPIDTVNFIQTNGIAGSATNLWRFLGANNSALYSRMANATNVTVSGSELAANITGTYATVTTNSAVQTNNIIVTVPLVNHSLTNATNIASYLALGISDYSTNAFATNSVALSNYVTLLHQQTLFNKVATNFTVQGGTVTNATITNAAAINGVLVGLTNGILHSPVITNSTLYATNGFITNIFALNLTATNLSSPGTGALSEKLGTNSFATGLKSLAIGANARASNEVAVAVGESSLADAYGASAFGQGAAATNYAATAIAVGALAGGTNSIAAGVESGATASDSSAFGTSSSASHTRATAIGVQAATTTTNQVRLGTSSETVSVAGDLQVVGSATNLTIRGTNVINARIDFTSRANTGLANGNNAGVLLGTNTYIRLSGASTIATIAGFESEQDGSFHVVEVSGAVTNIIANESGVDPTAANRITTGTGGDITLTNNPTFLHLLYNSTASRWRLINWTR